MKTVPPRTRFVHAPLGVALLLATSALFLTPTPAGAQCDTLDGPVVTAARAAIDARNVASVLEWVKPEDAWPIKVAFSHALLEGDRDPAARARSERAFFETLVRTHLTREGMEYTGLKPAASGHASDHHRDR